MTQTQATFNPIAAINQHFNDAIDRAAQPALHPPKPWPSQTAFDAVCDQIEVRLANNRVKGETCAEAARAALDAIHDEITDVEGLTGSLALAMLQLLNQNDIVEEVEARFAI